MVRVKCLKTTHLPKCADLQVILCLADAVFCAVEDHQSARDKQNWIYSLFLIYLWKTLNKSKTLNKYFPSTKSLKNQHYPTIVLTFCIWNVFANITIIEQK